MKEIKLTKGYIAILDDADHQKINKFKWHVGGGNKYAVRSKVTNGKKKTIYMHREILKNQKFECVDHINGDTLDNTRNNLRYVTFSQNQQNGKRHRGGKLVGAVKVTERNGKTAYIAQIFTGGVQKYLGYFKSEKEAHEKWKKADKLLRSDK